MTGDRATPRSYPTTWVQSPLRLIARLALHEDLFQILDTHGALGTIGPDFVTRGDTTWEGISGHLRNRLMLSPFHLQSCLYDIRQGTLSARNFAWEFEQRAKDCQMPEVTAKVALVIGLNNDTLTRLNAYITTMAGLDLVGLETAQARLGKIYYPEILTYLKQGNLLNLADAGTGATGLPPPPPQRLANSKGKARANHVRFDDSFTPGIYTVADA